MDSTKPPSDEFQNERITLKVTQSPGCVVEFKALASPLLCREAYQEAIKEVRRSASLPGFRKGKVPEEMIKRRFSSAIDSAWKDCTAQVAFRECMRLTLTTPWNSNVRPSWQVFDLSLEGTEVTFRFEREPQVPSVNLGEIEIPQIEVAEVTPEMVDKRIEDYLKFLGRFEPSEEERPLVESDFIRLDLETVEGGATNKIFTNQLAELKTPSVPAWLIRLLIGKSVGETVEGMSEPEPDATDEQKSTFEPRLCRVTIRSLVRWVPPEDKVLLAGMGVESHEMLRVRTEEQLRKEEGGRAQEKRGEGLWKWLLERYSFDLPASLVSMERQRRIRQIVSVLQKEHTPEEILKGEANIEQEALNGALAYLQRFFLAKGICQQTGNLLSKEEVEKAAYQLAAVDKREREGRGESEPLPTFEDYRASAIYQLMVRKVEDLLLKAPPKGEPEQK